MRMTKRGWKNADNKILMRRNFLTVLVEKELVFLFNHETDQNIFTPAGKKPGKT